MRQLLLLFITTLLCVIGVAKPKFGLFGYVWFSIVKPDDLAWTNGAHSMAIAIALGVGSLRYLPSFTVLATNTIVRTLLLLTALATVSTFAAVEPERSYSPYLAFLRMIAVLLMIPIVLRTERDVCQLLLVIGGSLGIIGAKLGLYALLRGGARFSAGYSNGFLSDNNTLALGLVMGVPICWHLRDYFQSRWIHVCLMACVFLSSTAIVMTYSRGAALSLAAVFLLTWLHSAHKVRMLMVLMVVLVPAIYFAGHSYLDRLATIQAPEEESSAHERLVAADGAIQMWKDHPWMGVGFGELNQMALQSGYVDLDQPMVVHNTYLEILSGSGIFAFVTYAGLLLGTLSWLEIRARRLRQERPGSDSVALAMQGALASFVVGACFLSRVEFDILYMLLLATAAYVDVSRSEETAPAEPDRRIPAGKIDWKTTVKPTGP